MVERRTRIGYLAKYLISIAGLITFLVTSIAVLLVVNISRNIENETVSSNMQRLRNVSDLVESRVLVPAYELLLESTLSSVVSTTDLSEPYELYLLYRILTNAIRTRSYVQELGVFFPEQQLLVSSRGVKYDLGNYSDADLLERLGTNGMPSLNTWFGPRFVRTNLYEIGEAPFGINVLTCVLPSLRKSPSGEPLYLIFVNVDFQSISAIVRPLLIAETEGLLVRTSSGDILAAEGSLDALSTIPAKSESGRGTDSHKVVKRTVYSSYISPDNRLTYTISSPIRTFFRMSYEVRNAILLGSGAVLLVGLALSGLLSKRLYRPLKLVLDKIGKPAAVKKAQDEYRLIGEEIDSLNEAISRLDHRMSQSVLNQILVGRVHLIDEDKIGILLPLNHSLVVALSCISGEIGRPAVARMEAGVRRIEHAYLLPVERNLYAILVNSNMEEKRFVRTVHRIFEDVTGSLDESFVAGMGNVVDHPELLHHSFEEAVRATKSRFLCPEERVFLYPETASRNDILERLDFSSFSRSVDNADKEGISTFIISMKEELSGGSYSLDSVEDAVFRLTSGLSRMVMRNRTEPGSPSLRRIYSDFFDCSTVFEALDWCNGFLNKQFSANESQDNAVLTIDKIRKYIDGNFAEPISLKFLSDEFCMSPGYISTMFRKHNTIGIAEYLSNIRLENARLMLENNYERIEKISTRVGMQNHSYFITKFKRKYGVTPNQYRLRFKREHFSS